ncbi:exosome non-catalytic core subunit RRP40 KNAG_0A01170 [Huiozyma naganishii CBS 8797]|uniref:Ribosomal RNA-processing protein 40 n=1 Tax=Huiozyma naganishii (strain ATCC MYA-139 / BCRC 22969 / CBS 8797 / KCTC 17520 / NBRC 10181 / NCYC 3082 / Yp74L-3) TaxID=1071383 RepID=J7S356_HUIN7|nr:hypothetical protein KNAG_0A01170 [Kazachstania naganishii CBS 8797]CCK67806.1 hypothetical protein KNAG_0A01170 [Kazachstania naganishii CBS 8797]
MSELVLPGDSLGIHDGVPVILGPGVSCDPMTQEVIPVNAGVRHYIEKKNTVYVDYNAKRYIPAVGDLVIGTIVSTFADSYKVSLSDFSASVSLSYMSFPNATKKNRPTLQVGDLVYARVLTAEKELEAEIECMDSVTGVHAGFGLLENGMVISVPLSFARTLLFNDTFPLLSTLAQSCQFEIAIGINGRIWVSTDKIENTLACYRSLNLCAKTNDSSKFKQIIKEQFKLAANVIEE